MRCYKMAMELCGYKMQEICWLAEKLWESKNGLCSMQLDS
jgi:hypothetical protein